MRQSHMATFYTYTEQARRMFARITSPPLKPNSWSLISSGAVSLARAAEERAPPSIRAELDVHGYIDGIAAPAVYWLNSMSASLGVRLIHGLVLGGLSDRGIDWLLDCSNGKWFNLEHPEEACLYTSNYGDGFFGRGFS